MAILFRLWLVASACWIGLIYWVWTYEAGYPDQDDWKGFAFAPPLAVFVLGTAIIWAFRGNRQRP